MLLLYVTAIAIYQVGARGIEAGSSVIESSLNGDDHFRFVAVTKSVSTTTTLIRSQIVYVHQTCANILIGTPPCAQQLLGQLQDTETYPETAAADAQLHGQSRSNQNLHINPSRVRKSQEYQWTTSGELNESVGPAVHHVQGSQEEQAEYAIIGFPETNRVYLHSFLHSLVAPLTIVRLDRVTVLLTTTATSPWPLSSDNDRVTFNIGGCVPDHLPYVLCTQRDV